MLWALNEKNACLLRFASWIHDVSAINLSLNDIDIPGDSKFINQNSLKDKKLFKSLVVSNSFSNNGWTLLNASLIRQEK